MQYLRCYSYWHITLQWTNKEGDTYWSGKPNFKTCLGNQSSRCILCRDDHKAYDQLGRMKKQEMKRISQTFALTPYIYSIKDPINVSSIFSPERNKEVFEDWIEVRPDPNLESSQPLTKIQPWITKFLAAGVLFILQPSPKKWPQSRSWSLIKTAWKTSQVSSKKNFIPRNFNDKSFSKNQFSQIDGFPLGSWDPNVSGIQSISIINCTLS